LQHRDYIGIEQLARETVHVERFRVELHGARTVRTDRRPQRAVERDECRQVRIGCIQDDHAARALVVVEALRERQEGQRRPRDSQGDPDESQRPGSWIRVVPRAQPGATL